MATEVRIQAPDDDLSIQVVEDLLKLKDEFAQAGIQLNYEKSSRFLPGLAEAIVIAFIAEVTAHYSIKLVDTLIRSIKSRRHYSVPVVVQHKSNSFTLPNQYDECIIYLRKLKADQPKD